MAGIQLASGFDLNSPAPLDSRFQVENITERNAIPTGNRYEGLLVYVKADKKYYSLTGGVANTNWSEMPTPEALTQINTRLADKVSKVNGVAPDANGNVEIEVPEVDTANLATKTELNSLGQLKLEDTYDTLLALQTAKPTGATGLYLVIEDGYTYRWNSTSWAQAVQFQSTGIAEASVSPKETTFFDIVASSKNLYNPNDSNIMHEFQIQENGTITTFAGWKVTGFIPYTPGQTLQAGYKSGENRAAANGRWIGYDSNKTPILATYKNSGSFTDANENIKYVRLSTITERFVELQIEVGTSRTAYEPYRETAKIKEGALPAITDKEAEFSIIEEADRLYALESKLGFTWKPFDTGKIVFMFDDGNSDLSTVNTVFNNSNFPVSLAFDTSKAPNLCDNGSTVLSAALDIQSHGGEILSHSIDGNQFSGMTNEEAERRLRESKRFLRENGFTVNGFVSPNGFDMSSYIELSAKYYRYGYRLHNSKTQYNLARTNMTSITVAAVKALIDQCATNKSLLILMAHSINGTENGFTQANLEEILAYCVGKTNIEVTTLRNVFNQFGGI